MHSIRVTSLIADNYTSTYSWTHEMHARNHRLATFLANFPKTIEHQHKHISRELTAPSLREFTAKMHNETIYKPASSGNTLHGGRIESRYVEIWLYMQQP